MRRWVGIWCGAAGGLIALTGCGVEGSGVVGVTVDAAGEPVIVIQMCDGYINGASLYRDDKTFGTWEVSSPVTGFSQFDLDSGGNGWALVGEFEARDPEQEYTIYGWSNDNRWSATHLTFSDRAVSGLKPGTVLVPEHKGTESESLEDFKTKTCDEWS